MKQLSKLLASLLLAASGALLSPGASADTICFNCGFAGDGTYLGLHNPATFDNSGFRHTQQAGALAIPTDGSTFVDDWIFSIDPTGYAAMNGSFQLFSFPSLLGITDFSIELLNATATCGVAGALCSSHSVGSVIATATYSPVTGAAAIPLQLLTGGQFYAIRVSGIANTNFTSYSGQLQTLPVPEPGVLALLGLGLAGIAVVRRRVK